MTNVVKKHLSSFCDEKGHICFLLKSLNFGYENEVGLQMHGTDICGYIYTIPLGGRK